MKIVIDIPEEEYELVRHGNKSYRTELELMYAVANGIPLPEGHGDLIDRDKLVPCCKFRGDCWADKCDKCSDYAVEYSNIKNAPTIIEADKGVLDQINEKQDSLKATCKAWDEAIEKDGYVN